MVRGFVEYLFANESLDSIVRGLRIRRTDRVLSCGGCGDQAFGLLECAESVRVLDINPAQVALIKKRKQLLKDGDYESFLADNPLGPDSEFYVEAGIFPKHRNIRNRYFQKRNRLESIRSKLDNLEIVEGDLTDVRSDRYHKIYLSNILGYRNPKKERLPEKQIRILSRILNIGGLIYVSNRSILPGYDLFPDLICDDQQTHLALLYNRLTFGKNSQWSPAVFVKMLEKIYGN